MTELPAGSDVCKLVGFGFLGACRRRPATAGLWYALWSLGRDGVSAQALAKEEALAKSGPRALPGILQGWNDGWTGRSRACTPAYKT